MAPGTRLSLLREIRKVTEEMARAAAAGEDGLDELVSLLTRRQVLMAQVDELDKGEAGKEDGEEIRRLLAEIQEMDVQVRKALESFRDEAREVLEKAQAGRKALAYLKQRRGPGGTGGLINEKG